MFEANVDCAPLCLAHLPPNFQSFFSVLWPAHWVMRTRVEPQSVVSVPSLTDSCSTDVHVTSLMYSHCSYDASFQRDTRERFLCKAQTDIGASSHFGTKCFRSFCWNICLRQVILALIRIPHVVAVRNVSPCQHLQHTTDVTFWWWDWRIVVDSVDTRVLWSERAVGIQGYGTKEENPQTSPPCAAAALLVPHCCGDELVRGTFLNMW